MQSSARVPTGAGIYVIRTSVPAAQLDTAQTVRVYKSLANVEKIFRSPDVHVVVLVEELDGDRPAGRLGQLEHLGVRGDGRHVW